MLEMLSMHREFAEAIGDSVLNCASVARQFLLSSANVPEQP